MECNDISCEPMDIDLSSQSIKEMDISYNDSDIDLRLFSRATSRNSVSTKTEQVAPRISTPVKEPVVKKYHIKIQKPEKRTKYRVLKTFAALSVVFLSIVAYHRYSLNCCDQLNIEKLNNTISSKVFGQSEAVELIIQTLDLKAKSKLLFFYGGTGVGKTFTSTLLLDSVDSCLNVYHYTMPSFKKIFSTDLMFGLVLCKMSIMIVDDLTTNDMDIENHIQEIMKKSEGLEKDLTVILIYNCNEDQNNSENGCDDNFESKLLNNFSQIKALKRFIKFKRLSENHLKECIKQELGYRQLSDHEFKELLKNFNVSVDGCKGVHSKMKYMNIV